MKPFKVLLFLAAFLFPAYAADPVPSTKDLKLLEGTWTMISGSADGEEMPEEFVKQMRRVFNGSELTVTMGSQIFFKAKISIDPTRKPKTIDYDVTDGVTK